MRNIKCFDYITDKTKRKLAKKMIDKLEEKDKEIEQLNQRVIIMEKYFELISDLGYDYDGFNNVEDLKSLINGLVRYANLGRACNTTECIYVSGDDNKKYNILNKELKGSDNNE